MQPSKPPFQAVRDLAQRLDGKLPDYDALLEMVHGRDLVLLGEASHGSSEFYRMREEITLRLIDECIDTMAIKGDWPGAWRVNHFVQGVGADDATSALDAQFFAGQNAQVVVNAEASYRGMFCSRLNTWNLRDSHMANTLFALARYRVRRGGIGKVVGARLASRRRSRDRVTPAW